MKLRDYQSNAVTRIFSEFEKCRSTVVVLPTGCGKTVVFGAAVHETLDRNPSSKVMILAHREELISQAEDKVGKITGAPTQVEMGSRKVLDLPGFQPKVVVSSVQTQVSRIGIDGRIGHRFEKFNPDEYALVVIDEAHHATSKSYRQCIEHYFKNPKCKLLGVTATPDRADETALGNVFESVAYEYSVIQAIDDGWLVPVKQKLVKVGSLDLSGVSTTAGDFNQGELATILEEEQNLLGIASATLAICGKRRAIVFAASVKQAERLAEILNRHVTDCADFVCGKTPKEDRQGILDAFREGKTQFVVNVGVLTEGFDDSGVEVVVVARPTKSRALYAQMAGRATRPAGEIAAKLGAAADAAERRGMIAASVKPECLIVDFVGNSGRHKLITTMDILAGNPLDDDDEDEVRRRVAKKCEETDGLDVMEELKKTREELLAEKKAEASRRKFIIATAAFTQFSVDPFDVMDIDRPQKTYRTGIDNRRLSAKQRQLLRERLKVDPDQLGYTEAKALLDEFFRRIQSGLASFAQTKCLRRNGFFFPVSFKEASYTISKMKGQRA